MATAEEILVRAAQRNLTLWDDPSWQRELIDTAPPVLWFGRLFDDGTELPKILTIAANPSRKEFVQGKEDPTPLKKPRFEVLRNHTELRSLISDGECQRRIIQGFNRYFETRPYTHWFGKKNGAKAEGLLNGLGASFYHSAVQGTLYRAVHADLVPFATMSDFRDIKDDLIEPALFAPGWACETLGQIISLVKPTAIIVLGSTNAEYYQRYFDVRGVSRRESFRYKTLTNGEDREIHWQTGESYGGIPTALVHLDPPRSPSRKTLKDLGPLLARDLGLDSRRRA